MLISYDIHKINEVLNDFYLATGVRIDLFGDDFGPISTNQNKNCNYCKYIQSSSTCRNACLAFDMMLLKRALASKDIEQEVCPFGLTNIVTPIIYQENIIGYLYFGQMKMEQNFNEEIDNPYLEKMKLAEHYSSLSLFDEEKAKSISNLAQMLISQILTENIIKPEHDEILQKTVNYINENLEGDLSIQKISKGINVSKSVLYSKFHSHFKCTIGEYINSRRIERSIEMLAKTTMSIEEVAQKSGFSSASYYTKMFKQQMGITPLKFKKSQSH